MNRRTFLKYALAATITPSLLVAAKRVAPVERISLSLRAVEYAPNQKVRLSGFARPENNGTFRLTFDGQTTHAIAYDASEATIQAALDALLTKRLA